MNETKLHSDDNPTPALSADLMLLKEHLSSANKVASKLAWSFTRVSQLLPLNASGVDALDDEEIERLDAYLYRFNLLTGMFQDHITRALLKAEEEDIFEKTRKGPTIAS